ncbi:MAG TPA: hypothetical protein PK156_17960 [Polyangium sp.]|nr:hypothetical protein [Polyangium sp.]
MPEPKSSPVFHIHDAIARLRAFDPAHPYQLNPVINEIEQQVLEHQCGYALPEIYSRFLLDVGNGGRWGSVFTYLSLNEVFDANDGALYRQPPPAFVNEALALGDLLFVPWDKSASGTGFPGLLRITYFSYNQLASYLTARNECVQIEVLDDELSVTAKAMTVDGFFQRRLDELREFGWLDLYERMRDLMLQGRSLTDMEQALGPTSSREWKHGIIARVLGTTPDGIEEKLAQASTRHKFPWHRPSDAQ